VTSLSTPTLIPGSKTSKATRPPRRSTRHLKEVPETPALRMQIRDACQDAISQLDRSHLLSRENMETLAVEVLTRLALPEGYLGWTMVLLASEFWRDQVAATPPQRRLLLLPHCLKHVDGCPAEYNEFGLDCKNCGACSIAGFRDQAEALGYRVLVAEGSPIVMKIIVSGYIDAIVGVACLNVLEKSLDKILVAGIPCMAVPLLSSDCKHTTVDESWVHDMIHGQQDGPAVQTRTFLPLLRSARKMFEPDELQRLVPRQRGMAGGQSLEDLDPIAATEAIAYDFLAQGGKYSRPFITLATYDAVTGGHSTKPDGTASTPQFSDSIFRAAMSIESFHKASLVHDDIQDGDLFRYGQSTLHQVHGVPTAINVGDYLIGMGYRLVSRDAKTHGAETAADILDKLAECHTRLSEGQGAELVWRDRRDRRLSPLEALKIYALKTAPAFEAAMYCGLRLAGPADEYTEPVKQLAKHLGIAFQILNDLKDWQGDNDNKLIADGDVAGGRPTLLWALALEGLEDDDRSQLEELASTADGAPASIGKIRRLYKKAGAFEKAHRMVDKHQQRAEMIADDLQPDPLRRLVYYLIDTVLERPEEAAEPEVVSITV